MKRRTLIIGIAAVSSVIPSISQADNRLYGIPVSVQYSEDAKARDKIKLSLARTDLSPEMWDDVSKLSQLSEKLYSDARLAKAFSISPRAALIDADISPETLNENSIEVKMLQVSLRPEVLAMANAGEYLAFMQILEDERIIGSRTTARSGMETFYREQMAKDAGKYRDLFVRLQAKPFKNWKSSTGSLDSFNKNSTIPRDICPQEPCSDVDTVVFVHVDAFVLVLVDSGVSGNGKLARGDFLPLKKLGDGKSLLAISPFPVLVEDYQRAARVGALAGHPEVAVSLLRDLFDQQTSAIFAAAESTHLVKLSISARKRATERMRLSMYRNAGLA